MACGPLTLSEAQGSWGGGPVGEYGVVLAAVVGAGSRRGRRAQAQEPAAPVRLDARWQPPPWAAPTARARAASTPGCGSPPSPGASAHASPLPASLTCAQRGEAIAGGLLCAAGCSPLPRVEGRRERDTPREAAMSPGSLLTGGLGTLVIARTTRGHGRPQCQPAGPTAPRGSQGTRRGRSRCPEMP